MWCAAAACLLTAAATVACHQPHPHEPVTVVMVVTGRNVTLTCPLDARRAATGWAYFTPAYRRRRHRRLLALAVDMLQYTTDSRYALWRAHVPPRWQLTIARVTPADTGLYRCHALYEVAMPTTDDGGQLNSDSRWVRLAVVAADRTLIDDEDDEKDNLHLHHHRGQHQQQAAQRGRRVLAGQPLVLSCSADRAVSWQRDGQRLDGGGLLRLDVTTEADSGVYSCHARGLRPDSVRVDVVSTEAAGPESGSGADQLRRAAALLPLLLATFLVHNMFTKMEHFVNGVPHE